MSDTVLNFHIEKNFHIEAEVFLLGFNLLNDWCPQKGHTYKTAAETKIASKNVTKIGYSISS